MDAAHVALTAHLDHARGNGLTVSVQDVLTSTTPVLSTLSVCSLHDTPNLLVQMLNVPPLSLGLLSAKQSLCLFLLTLAPLAQCTHCHFVTQARALRVPELCDDHIPSSCLVVYPLAKLGHRSVTGDIPSVCIVPAFRQVVRFGTSWPTLFTCLCLAACCSTSLWCLLSSLSVLGWGDCGVYGCLLAPLSGITLTSRAIRSQHDILSNNYKLVPVPRPLCRCWPTWEGHRT